MANFVYTQATVNVSNAQPGQKIVVNLVPQAGQQVSWSTGDPNRVNSNGIKLSAPQGAAVPVQSFSVTSQALTVYTSSDSGGGGGSLSFNVSTYLAGVEGISIIGLNSSSDPGVLVQFAFAGQDQTTLSQTTILLNWA